MLKVLFSSKKFLVAFSGVILAVVAHFNESLVPLVSNVTNFLIAYIVGQGLADLGKEKK